MLPPPLDVDAGSSTQPGGSNLFGSTSAGTERKEESTGGHWSQRNARTTSQTTSAAATANCQWLGRTVRVTRGKGEGLHGTVTKSGHGFYCIHTEEGGEATTLMKRGHEIELVGGGSLRPKAPRSPAPSAQAKVQPRSPSPSSLPTPALPSNLSSPKMQNSQRMVPRFTMRSPSPPARAASTGALGSALLQQQQRLHQQHQKGEFECALGSGGPTSMPATPRTPTQPLDKRLPFNTMYTCEECGAPHYGTFGSGRFCSKSCGARFAVHSRPGSTPSFQASSPMRCGGSQSLLPQAAESSRNKQPAGSTLGSAPSTLRTPGNQSSCWDTLAFAGGLTTPTIRIPSAQLSHSPPKSGGSRSPENLNMCFDSVRTTPSRSSPKASPTSSPGDKSILREGKPITPLERSLRAVQATSRLEADEALAAEALVLILSSATSYTSSAQVRAWSSARVLHAPPNVTDHLVRTVSSSDQGLRVRHHDLLLYCRVHSFCPTPHTTFLPPELAQVNPPPRDAVCSLFQAKRARIA